MHLLQLGALPLGRRYSQYILLIWLDNILAAAVFVLYHDKEMIICETELIIY